MFCSLLMILMWPWEETSTVFIYSTILTRPFYCLLISAVSDEKSAVNQICCSLVHEDYFLLASFKISFLCLAFSGFIICEFLCFYLTLMSYLDVYINVFHQIGDVFSHFFLKYLFGPFFTLLSSWSCHYRNIYVLQKI